MNIACLGFLFEVDAELKFHYPVFFLGAHLKLWRAEKGALTTVSDTHMCEENKSGNQADICHVLQHTKQRQLSTKQQTIGDLFFSFMFHELGTCI